MKKGYEIYLLIGSLLCLLCIVGRSYYNKQPEYQVHAYIDAINEGDFYKAYTYLYKDEIVNANSQQHIIEWMKMYHETEQFSGIRVNTEKSISYIHEETNTERMYFEVAYLFDNQVIETGLSLTNVGGMWQVIFPFKTSDVIIQAPVNANVYFNEQLLTNGTNGSYAISGVLPGQHMVFMQFADNTYENFIEVIQVPQVTEVTVPYHLIDVNVEVPYPLVGYLDGIQSESREGVLNFYNVLEGSYTLHLIDPFGVLESFSQTVFITSENTRFDVNELIISKEGQAKIETFMEAFYKDYEKGIKTQDTAFYDTYIEDTAIINELEESFKQWFIDHKEVTGAYINFNIMSTAIGEDGFIEVVLWEEIYLENKEVIDGKESERIYKVIRENTLQLKAYERTFNVIEKNIGDTLIAYRDEDGDWIAY